MWWGASQSPGWELGISLKAWESCCSAEEEAEGQTHLEATSSFLERDRIDSCDVKPNSIHWEVKS